MSLLCARATPTSTGFDCSGEHPAEARSTLTRRRTSASVLVMPLAGAGGAGGDVGLGLGFGVCLGAAVRLAAGLDAAGVVAGAAGAAAGRGACVRVRVDVVGRDVVRRDVVRFVVAELADERAAGCAAVGEAAGAEGEVVGTIGVTGACAAVPSSVVVPVPHPATRAVAAATRTVLPAALRPRRPTPGRVGRPVRIPATPIDGSPVGSRAQR